MLLASSLKTGERVDIKRTDGRIHSAVISGVTDDPQSVTVEWFERGETKGKEIDVETLLQLNPGLGGGDSEPPSKESDKKHRRTVNATKIPPPKRGNTMVNGMVDEENFDPTANINNNNPTVDKNLGKRKSQVVNEIERMKKNRDERRAKQAEIKEQRQQYDPSNPNWKFAEMIDDYRDQLDYRPLRLHDSIDLHRICVCVRKRPLNKKENGRKEIDVLTIPNRDHLIVHQPQTKVDLTKYLENQKFRFDYAFNEDSTNEMVYRFTAQPLVRTIFEQGFATCFAYGQTGSGKTHTMGGDFEGKSQDCSKGIYAMTARDVFKMLNAKEFKNEGLIVSCSFFEIYGGKVFDLLAAKAKLRILEDGKHEVQIVGLQEVPVTNESEVLGLIKKGTEVRTAGQTSANNQSSRSHAVFQIILRKNRRKLHGKFSLIDLAGNERGADTMSSDRQTRMEGAEINKSLLALKECIRAMGRNSTHLPFRASKLTLVLRDSFVGQNSRTCMIAMISPGLNSCEHTLNTLRYADRVKELGASDEVESTGAGRPVDFPMSDSPHPSDADMALLQSRNEGELSDELYKFQLLMTHIQDDEESAVEEHSKMQQFLNKFTPVSAKCLKKTEKVEYDVYTYATEMRSLMDNLKPQIDKYSDQLDTLIEAINQEEQIAKSKNGIRKK